MFFFYATYSFQSRPEIGLTRFLISFIETCYAFGTILIVSELGQQTSDSFIELSEVSLQFDWYLFSNEINQLLLIILPVVQKPVVIECFGSITCDRESIKKARQVFIRIKEH